MLFLSLCFPRVVFCPFTHLLYALSLIINDISCLAAEQNGGWTLHQWVVLYQTTLVPPSAETTATRIIYTLNRMLNFGCVPISVDQCRTNGHQNWLISQVQEHEIHKDSKDGLPRRSACSTFLTWWSYRLKAKLLKRTCIVKVHPGCWKWVPCLHGHDTFWKSGRSKEELDHAASKQGGIGFWHKANHLSTNYS